jgi:uncharacterized protein YndB with AHSA1/START domain
MSKSWGYAHRVDVMARADRIWQALTVAAELDCWCCPGASIQPRTGGLFRVRLDHVGELEASIDVFEPPRRLRLIYLPTNALPPAETTLVDDFILDAGKELTVVRLLGSGVPSKKEWEQPFMRIKTSWERALPRLKVFVEQQMVREGSQS